MPLILERSGTQYVAMVTKLLQSNCGAHLVESAKNQTFLIQIDRYIFSSYLIKIWLST